MISALNKLPDETIELTITIPTEVVKKTWGEIVKEETKGLTIPGFRKGKAPRKLAEEKLDKEKIKEEVLKKLLPEAYSEAIKEHSLRPIINPQIHVEKLEDPSTSPGWQFTALTCEAPEVQLGNYKEEIRKITAKEKIILPGKEPQKTNLEELIEVLLTSVLVKISGILQGLEVDRLLSQTLDEIKKLGLSLDQYLASTKRTVQDLRGEYEKKAERDLKLEFILQKIAQEEKITVSEKEVEEVIQKAKNEEERKNLAANRYLLAGILRQQKTLDFIRNL